jgi:uncharacterized protein
MEKYKASQFNEIVKLDDGGMLIYNLHTKKNAHITVDNAEKILSVLNQESITIDNPELSNSPIFKILNENGFIVPYYKTEYRHVDISRRQISYSTKNLDLTILPTSDCNFRCIYCFEDGRKKYMSEETVDRIIKFMDKSFAKYKTVYIQWFGGEPLLCKDIIYKIMSKAREYAKRDRVALMSGITTNGYELDLETYDILCKNRINWVQVSVDGTKELHNKQRPHEFYMDSYSKIINNFRDIRDNATSSVCKIYYRITISKSIIPHIREVLTLYKNEFHSDRRFKLSLQPALDWGGVESKI